MTGLRVLVIGGTGIISTTVVAEALAQGHEVHTLSRSGTPQPHVRAHAADVRDRGAVTRALGDTAFDVVAQFVAFNRSHVRADIEQFAGRTGQYIFVSSASAYQTPPQRLPVTESTPLRNPYWEYSRNKIACEDVLVAEYRDRGFPATIVRPSHTYNPTMVPFDGGWTVVERMRRGAEVVVPGDGTSLWTITHHTDFARAFVGLFGRPEALGEAFHITSDEALTWNSIYTHIARAAGVTPKLVHVASESIAATDPEWGAALLGDKANSMTFDNTKIRRIVPDFVCRIPFSHGAREIVEWHDAHPAARRIDPQVEAVMDALVEQYRPRALPIPEIAGRKAHAL